MTETPAGIKAAEKAGRRAARQRRTTLAPGQVSITKPCNVCICVCADVQCHRTPNGDVLQMHEVDPERPSLI